MAYKLKLKESLEHAVRRIAVEQLDKASIEPGNDAERAVWVHQTRKALKRTRALLRLVRSGVDPATWKAENAALRDIARSLSSLRDRDILRQLVANFAADGDAALVAALGRSQSWLDAPFATAIPDKTAADILADARGEIEAAQDRLARLAVHGDLPDVLAEGISSGQRRGARALARVEIEPNAENLHDLRKAVQATWRQLVLVQAAWPDVITARAAAARELAELLGEIQDYAVLATAAKPPRGCNAVRRRDAARIIAACREGQLKRQSVAIGAAARLFASPPRAIGREVAACWQASLLLTSEPGSRRKAPNATSAQAIRHASSKRRTG